VFECVRDFQNECTAFVEERTANANRGIDRLRAISKAYIEYFVEYPGIFELFYIERMSAYGNSKETAELIYVYLDKLCENDWRVYAEKLNLNNELVEKLKDQLRYTLIGLLLFYLNRHYPSDYDQFLLRAEKQLSYIWD
jgi:hypothetical protein